MASEREEPATDPPIEESAEDLYENAPCGYISALPDGTIARVNSTFLTWTGYRRDDLVGRRRFQDLLSAGGRIFHETHYAPLLRMQGWVREIAVDVVCADGRRLPALINSVLRTDAAGNPVLVRTTVFNATDRKEYERELLRERQRAEQAVRAKSDFISMVSHEIRTPLNAIMAVGELLGTTELSPAQQRYLRILRSSSESLLNLINQVLDFSRIEAGKLALEERSLDLRGLVQEVAAGLQVKAEEKGLAFHFDIDPGVPAELLGDPVKIGQVLTNLLGNAVKFTSEGSVRLRLQPAELTHEAASIEFHVEDTGIGISADRLPHIFDDYTQASYEIGRKYGGTGLGLAITRRLIELHGSRISVESEPGRGTIFSFTLRLKTLPPEKKAEPLEAGAAAAPPLQGLRVLVVDDNSVNVVVLTGFLDGWGARTNIAASGREAVELVQEQDYDLVLMDLKMPEMDGYEAAREIRSLPGPKYRRLPIFAVSASVRIGSEPELAASGFTAFVGKPVDAEILLEKIARYARPSGS